MHLTRLALLLALAACRNTDKPMDEVDPDLDGDGVPASADCDDEDPSVFPGADERCDGRDDDCDGSVDEDATDATPWYRDADADGYGDPLEALQACAAPSGYVVTDEDCDDTDAAVHPGATEEDCLDPVDYNCDGSVGYADADADGWPACEDCDDSAAAVNPAGVEVCDDQDNDCDGDVDQDALDAVPWFADGDADGFGAGEAVRACEAPEGFTASDNDCDDTDDHVHPGADERCDGRDNDCDGDVDQDAVDASTWYLDADGDGYGAPRLSLVACAAPEGYLDDAQDCDDLNPDAFPGNPEVCDLADNDCDGLVDDDPSDQGTWYADLDGDGFGAGEAIAACDAPAGAVDNDRDCDDAHPAAAPGHTEVCDGIDNDCDGTADQGAVDASRWYPDLDGDGFAAGAPVLACEAPAGHLAEVGDCDDAAPAIHPDATEVCDGIDNNCNGVTDLDAASPPSPWYADADGDGFGAGAQVLACGAPAGHVSTPGDCDDAHGAVNPDATEVCDGIDNDCNGVTDLDAAGAPTWYLDVDGDGYGADRFALQACAAPGGYVADGGDCADLDPTRNPGAVPACDGSDMDCDGHVDHDGDGDGFPDQSCGGTDCDDGAGTVFPAAPELCDGLVNTCGGALPDDEADLDGDGFVSCAEDLGGWGGAPVSGYEDCDDLDAAAFPGAPQACDDVDHDCDGAVDQDADGDGYSDAACGGTDCDDADADLLPDSNGLCALGTTCLDLQGQGLSASGSYVIDPDGFGLGELPFETRCDMETDGGGWTLIFQVNDLGGTPGGLSEDDFIALFGHNQWTDEPWSYEASTLYAGLSSSLANGQGMAPLSALEGTWDDLRMACSLSDLASDYTHWMQVDGYASANGSWDLLGAVPNSTTYAVDGALNSRGITTVWHDNEPNGVNSGHYLCDVTNSTGDGGLGAAQFGFCYTDFLNNPNTMDYGDAVVSLAFGTRYGPDEWSVGFTLECGPMGTTAQQNHGTYAIWVR